MPVSGQYRALVVYVRFRDDASTDSDGRGWPASLSSPPSFADDVIASSPTPSSFPNNSISRYFYDQSDPSNPFILYGDTYPNIIVTDNDEFDYYRVTQNGDFQNSGFGILTLEVLSKIDPYINFADYDRNGDGEIDYLFIIVRASPKGSAYGGQGPVRYSGVSHLEKRSGTISDTRWPSPGRPTVSYDGKALNWRNGSYIFNSRAGNIIPELYHPVVWAHEIGHDLWEDYFFTHIEANQFNDVPQNGTVRLGYTLMASTNLFESDDAGGNETISAFERDLIGWIDCQPLSSGQSNVSVGDLYTTGDCRKVDLDNGAAGKTVYVSNQQRVSYFDQLFTFTEGNFYAEDGLMTTGLVAGIRQDGYSEPLYDELPADNTLDLSILSSTYDGDLYDPSLFKQITPWTRPNINGYTEYPAGYEPSCEVYPNVKTEIGRVQGSMLPVIVSEFGPTGRPSPAPQARPW